MLQQFLKRLLPNEDRFYTHLEEVARNLSEGAAVFSRLREVSTHEEIKAIAEQLDEIEGKGDDLERGLHDELHRTFVTPIDREDLHGLTNALETVLDGLEGTSARFALLGLEQPTPPMRLLVEKTVASVEEVVQAVSLLRDLKRPDEVRVHVANVNRLEEEADDIYRGALADLFASPPEPVELIRRQALLNSLERAVDLCEDAMDVIRTVMIKNT